MKRRFIKTLLKFRYALRGIKFAFFSQKSLRYESIVAIIVLMASAVFLGKRVESAIVILCVFVVISLELMNTAIERLCDFIHPKYDKAIGLIKDVSSAAVFVACVGSVTVGLILFL